MLAELLWLLTELRSSGANVNGDAVAPACAPGQGAAALDLAPGRARVTGLSAGLSLLRGAPEGDAETTTCRLVLPFSFPQGTYPASIDAAFVYSLAKSLGSRARVSVTLNVAGFALSRYTLEYPRGSFYEPSRTLPVAIAVDAASADAANLRRFLCRRPDYPIPVGVDVSIEASRQGPGEEVRVGGALDPYVELGLGEARACPAEGTEPTL